MRGRSAKIQEIHHKGTKDTKIDSEFRTIANASPEAGLEIGDFDLKLFRAFLFLP